MSLVLAAQGIDHVPNREERLVDVLRFVEAVARGVSVKKKVSA